MGTPFLSEIRQFSFNFPPKGWAFCNGQILPINQNQALFSLLGTTYGGNGQTTFALPDLRARIPIGEGSGHSLGERDGEDAHTLSLSELPSHTHTVNVSGAAGTATIPTGNFLAAAANAYGDSSSSAVAVPTVTSVGGSQAHENRQPFLVLNFCIALVGIFPSQT